MIRPNTAAKDAHTIVSDSPESAPGFLKANYRTSSRIIHWIDT
jgi:hypothetical protein